MPQVTKSEDTEKNLIMINLAARSGTCSDTPSAKMHTVALLHLIGP